MVLEASGLVDKKAGSALPCSVVRQLADCLDFLFLLYQNKRKRIKFKYH